LHEGEQYGVIPGAALAALRGQFAGHVHHVRDPPMGKRVEYTRTSTLRELRTVKTTLKADRDKFLTPDQFRRLLAAARGIGQPARRERNYMLLCLAGNLGLRVSEAVVLRVGDFHLDGPRPFVRVLTLKRRPPVLCDLPIEKKLRQLVLRYHAHLGVTAVTQARTFWLFASSRNNMEHLSSNMAQLVFKQAARAAGLLDSQPALSFHALRHMRALMIFQATDNLAAVQRFMRWSSPATAANYSHTDPDKESEVNARVGAIL
jgi:integrase